ncbi:hypothetical protein [Bradyrhizobium sp. C-145]|nr:hypothetical protein [Bradyrhizobium sp. C-145]
MISSTSNEVPWSWWQKKTGRMIREQDDEGLWPLLVDRAATAGAV